jgi:GNAT superfamily N-acetyltransferase
LILNMTANIAIRLLTGEDVDAALALSASCGWNQRAAEWHMMLQIAPSGTFAASTPGGVVGTAIGIDYGNFGWIAMMLVDPAWRGRGLGARLLEAAMGAMPPELPIRLDATPLGRPLYERYGFVLESSLTRHVRPADAGPLPASRGDVRPLGESDLATVMRLDERISGAHRHGPLGWAFGDAPQYAWISASAGGSLRPKGGSHPLREPASPEPEARGRVASGFSRPSTELGTALRPSKGRKAAAGADISGYCLGRGGRLFDHIGPIVADATESATALAAAAIAGSNRALVIDAHDGHEPFTAWLRNAQFESQRPLYRMCRPGSAPPPSRPAPPLTEFAIMGPEFS